MIYSAFGKDLNDMSRDELLLTAKTLIRQLELMRGAMDFSRELRALHNTFPAAALGH